MELDFDIATKKRKFDACEIVVNDHHDDQQVTSMENLPIDVILDIFSRLPITSLVQFKFVSKPWRAIAEDPHVLRNHVNDTPRDPCLILHCDFPIRNELCFADLSARKDDKEVIVSKFRTPFVHNLPEFVVAGSCNGLLCLSDSLYNDAMYIYNPFTRDYMEIPKSIKFSDQEVVFGFGFNPKTKQYKVIKIIYYRNSNTNSRTRRIVYPKSDVQVFTLGTNSWRSLGKSPYQLIRSPSEALVNGILHFVSKPRRYFPARKIVAFDLNDEQFREVAKPDCGGLNKCNFQLALLNGCLAAAVYGNYGKLEIWIMKKYNVKESWVKEYNIGAYMPKGLKQNYSDRPLKIWKSSSNARAVRVICQLETGEILLEYKSRALVSYDPKKNKFKNLDFQGMPNWFQTVVHEGSLNWIDTLK
ncbi:hypothetical protein ACFE04_016606 [Oxalis oulophora]